MSQIDVPLSRAGFGQTQRADNWWVQPLVVFLGLSAFIVYSTWAALQGQHFRFGPYLSPFYSPELFGPAQGWFGPKPKLDACLGYRSDAHSVGAGRLSSDVLLLSRGLLQGFLGRSAFLHRGRAAEDISRRTIVSFDPAKRSPVFSLSGSGVSRNSGARRVGCVLVRRPVRHRRRHSRLVDEPRAAELLHFGCHSFRHLVGGFRDRLAGAPARKRVYDCVSCLNRRHMLFAWCSLFSVAFSDLYVRMCSMGIWTDWRIV